MGADRGIRIQCERDPEPLAVAKLFKAVVEKEGAEQVILGEQAVDNDDNRTGQMLAALLGWPQGTFSTKIEKTDGTLAITREVDGGLEKLELKLPAVVTTDLRLNEPRYADRKSVV